MLDPHYTIKAYRSPNCGGGLVLVTQHATEMSRDVEIAAFRARMRRGEIGHIEVIAHVEPFGIVRIR